eukprot:TRINITY_DN2367_c0_g1_i1.p1 TRINITY_DN2367_c0_g1~~TRINITY_DN2367_c0_g1_i1.p1  ORF type:complete len:215 (+),score=73.71 TRINITY_DN2367_c0_g1_i1:134-778(+)
MDQFVIRTPREPPAKASEKRRRRNGSSALLHGSQSRIEDCSGVVHLKDLERLQALLEEEEDSSQEDLKERLEKISRKKPSSKILKESGILKSLKKRRHSLPEAKQVYSHWKELLKRRERLQSTPIQVAYDLASERIRQKSNDLFIKSVSPTHPHLSAKQRQILLNLEKELFRACDCKSTNQYRRLSRKIIFALKEESVAQKLFDNPKDFLRLYL